MNRILHAAGLALGVGLLAPTAAHAVSATVTGDDGQAIPLTAPAQIRNMSPDFALAFDPGEGRYSLTLTGPGGQAAVSPTSCFRTSSHTPERVSYQGNGTYTAAVATFAADDTNCATPTGGGQFQFTIAAFSSIGSPAGKLYTRPRGSLAYITHEPPVFHNPGSAGTEVMFARGVKANPDNSLPGSPTSRFVSSSSPNASIVFTEPGRYTVVTRPTTLSANGPFSAPVFYTVVEPFDFSVEPDFIDSTGPRYKVQGFVRADQARGKRITVRYAAPGQRKLRRLARPKVRKGGRFSFSFTLRRPGRYRVRYTYPGNRLVDKGAYRGSFTITRRYL